MTSSNIRVCPGCLTPFAHNALAIADNRYGITSPECRIAFDEILVHEGSHYGYPPVHRLIIDAYAIQHPPHLEHQLALGINQRFIDASVQSIAIHLIALYVAIEKKMDLRTIAQTMDRILSAMNQQGVSFKEITPPADLGIIKAIDVRNLLTEDLELADYSQLAWKWAYSAWNAWSVHHKTVQQLYEKYSR